MQPLSCTLKPRFSFTYSLSFYIPPQTFSLSPKLFLTFSANVEKCVNGRQVPLNHSLHEHHKH